MDDVNPLIRALERQADGYASFFYDVWVNQAVNGISGDYVEFGSWGGNTLSASYKGMVALTAARPMWAFDSFEGLPPATDERDDHWLTGTDAGQGGVENFYAACDAHGVPRDAYTAVEGYYDAVLPTLSGADAPDDIACAYLDCNMYTSTVTVLEFLEPRLKHGMILAFDDYWHWSPRNVSGERSAFHEFRERNPQWHFERYHDVHRCGVSFVVEHAHLLS